MNDLALWLKALHIVAVIAWMAALLYMPRLFVYHSKVAPGTEASETFKIMERRLLKAIMTPAMLASLLFGISLGVVQAQWTDAWLHLKSALVAALAASHMLMARYVRAFSDDRRPASETWFRWFNEMPTLLMLGIVFLVVFKPF
ncbi:MAG: protoporphyrinogen oxidase HemJ [Alphaproteobacteria bacterium]|nr:protoporphyrinogen oxidase HemJ [Alphaproteobacteria bacterium]